LGKSSKKGCRKLKPSFFPQIGGGKKKKTRRGDPKRPGVPKKANRSSEHRKKCGIQGKKKTKGGNWRENREKFEKKGTFFPDFGVKYRPAHDANEEGQRRGGRKTKTGKLKQKKKVAFTEGALS